MGMDVYVSGELTIKAANVLAAGQLLLKAILVEDEEAENAPDPEDVQRVTTPEGIVKLLNQRFDNFGATLEANGDLEFGMSDSCRHEEYDQWIFRELAPHIEDGELLMEGDGYHWKWLVSGGEFGEEDGETIYSHDAKAVPLVEKLVAIIYPHGSPLSACTDPNVLIAAISDIENLLRETGYGPQVGMNGLERLADA